MFCERRNTQAKITTWLKSAFVFGRSTPILGLPDFPLNVNAKTSGGESLPPPAHIFNRDGEHAVVADQYDGQRAFLLCGGPSLQLHDLKKLHQPGLITMAVNNAATVFRPHLWTSVDEPKRFSNSIWYDPNLTKFVPLSHIDSSISVQSPDGDGSSRRVRDMPGVYYFCRNSTFNPERFLHDDRFHWGNSGARADVHDNKGARSVLLVALRLLFYLGVRRVFLLGCDFKMKPYEKNYAFEQNTSLESVAENNRLYQVTNHRLNQLRPYFDAEGFHVLNCTPSSELTAFAHADFDEAVARSTISSPSSGDASGLQNQGKSTGAASTGSVLSSYDTNRHSAGCEQGLLSLEIVSHCWRYSRLLLYQLSSLVLYPPKKSKVTMTVFYSRSDEATSTVLEYFAARTPNNVSWRWWPLDEPKLFRRAIGRNMAALATTADWIWFCDCDQLFRRDCLDELSDELSGTGAVLAYPEYVHFTCSEGYADQLLVQGSRPHVLDVDPAYFAPVRFTRATGALQIARGDVVRKTGYCKDSASFMSPSNTWSRTFEDVEFRKILGTQGTPIQVPDLFHIQHSVKGRLNPLARL